MAHLEYFLVAESVIVDQATNVVSLVNVLEELTAPAFPIMVAKCAAVSAWNEDPGDVGRDLQVTLRIRSPGSESSIDFHSNFTMRTSRHRVLQRIAGLPVLAAGELQFEVLLNGEHKAFHTVSVRTSPAL